MYKIMIYGKGGLGKTWSVKDLCNLGNVFMLNLDNKDLLFQHDNLAFNNAFEFKKIKFLLNAVQENEKQYLAIVIDGITNFAHRKKSLISRVNEKNEDFELKSHEMNYLKWGAIADELVDILNMATMTATLKNAHLVVIANDYEDTKQVDNVRLITHVAPDFQGSFDRRYYAFFDWVLRCQQGGTKYNPYPPTITSWYETQFIECRASGLLQDFTLRYAEENNLSSVENIPLDWQFLLNLNEYEQFKEKIGGENDC